MPTALHLSQKFVWFYQSSNSILLEDSHWKWKTQGQRSSNSFPESAFHVSTVANVVHINYHEQQPMKRLHPHNSCACDVGLPQPPPGRVGTPSCWGLMDHMHAGRTDVQKVVKPPSLVFPEVHRRADANPVKCQWQIPALYTLTPLPTETSLNPESHWCWKRFALFCCLDTIIALSALWVFIFFLLPSQFKLKLLYPWSLDFLF